MSDLDELMNHIPISDLAAHLGVDEATAKQAVSQALPALVGGLQSNAASPDGAASLQGALQQHPASLLDGGVSLGDVDASDGEKILGHVFGGTEQATQAAALQGGPGQAAGISGGMVGKLLPLLAPIVLSYLTKKMTTGSSSESAGAGSSGNPLQDVLGSILGGFGR